MVDAFEYLQENKLIDLLTITQEAKDEFNNVYANVNADKLTNFPPDYEDLARLHYLIRVNQSMTVLEFGVGYSSFVIADALYKNASDYSNLTISEDKMVRNRNLYKLYSVDTSRKWINEAKKKLPEHLSKLVSFNESEAQITLISNEMCSMYKQLPDIVPDFIYLDGPDPKEVKGNINGLSFSCDERTIISADILLYESTLIPGATILVDGRTNNVRFLERNLKRNWNVSFQKENDISILKLDETPLGRINETEIGIKKTLSANIKKNVSFVY